MMNLEGTSGMPQLRHRLELVAARYEEANRTLCAAVQEAEIVGASPTALAIVTNDLAEVSRAVAAAGGSLTDLAAAERAGLVRSYRVGRESRYEPRTAGLTATADWLTVLAAEWNQRLARIKALAEDPDA